MAQIRELKRRIKSVENTRQITKTMEMVATSRLKRAQDRVVAARPYAQALTDVISSLYDPELEENFPLLRQADAPKNAAVILITSNRGLCGAFNANLIKAFKSHVDELEGRGVTVEMHGIGRKGIGFFKYIGRTWAAERIDIGDRPTSDHARSVIVPLMGRFALGELDRVDVVFAKFNSPLSTPPTILQILPIEPPRPGDAGASRRQTEPERGSEPDRPGAEANYILKPSAEEILEALLPLYVRNQMYRALVETAASEHGARRTAMKSATDSAGDMIDSLRRTYNRARQAQITQEIAEIVGGAEALS
jgi:F-type H+-transporting ATPase subunit gamma